MNKEETKNNKIEDERLDVNGGANTETENETSEYKWPKRPTDPPGKPGEDESYRPW